MACPQQSLVQDHKTLQQHTFHPFHSNMPVTEWIGHWTQDEKVWSLIPIVDREKVSGKFVFPCCLCNGKYLVGQKKMMSELPTCTKCALCSTEER